MSMLGNIKKNASKVASKVSKIGSVLTSNQIRSSTLYDFSTVEKATLRFASINDLEPTEPIPVQINPSDISYSYQSYTTEDNLLSNIQGEARHIEISANPFIKSTMSFTLYYDFYDEYYARSAGGSGFSLNMLSDKNGFCLTNPTYSSLQRIIDKSCDVSTYVLFKWGNVKHFGQLETVNPHYTAFSPYGEPLKATASVEMRIFIETINGKEWIKEGPLKDVYEALTGTYLPYVGGDDAFKNKVASKLNTGEKLLRHTYPTIKALR